MPESSVSAVIPASMTSEFAAMKLNRTFPSSSAGFPAGTIARTLQMRAAIRQTRPDIIHYPASFARATGRGGLRTAKVVVTVHDLSFLHHPEWFKRGRAAYYRAAIQPTVTLADLLLADSEATAQDLMSLLGVPNEKIVVTPLGVDEEFAPSPAEHIARVRRTYTLPDRFFLYLGTIEPRKNLPRVIEAFESIADACDLDLVIAGREGWRAESTRLAYQRARARSRIRFPGFIPSEDMPAVLSAATVFVWPSLFEGFGLPPLEAMACGTPVITSSTSSLPEVVGDAAIQVVPEEVSQIAHAMQRLASDETERARLRTASLERARRFTWRRTAECTAKAYQRVLGG